MLPIFIFLNYLGKIVEKKICGELNHFLNKQMRNKYLIIIKKRRVKSKK